MEPQAALKMPQTPIGRSIFLLLTICVVKYFVYSLLEGLRGIARAMLDNQICNILGLFDDPGAICLLKQYCQTLPFHFYEIFVFAVYFFTIMCAIALAVYTAFRFVKNSPFAARDYFIVWSIAIIIPAAAREVLIFSGDFSWNEGYAALLIIPASTIIDIWIARIFFIKIPFKPQNAFENILPGENSRESVRNSAKRLLNGAREAGLIKLAIVLILCAALVAGINFLNFMLAF